MAKDLKTLAESILSDITSDVAITNILLKTKVFAAKIGDKELLECVSNELNGYKDAPPEYRIINAGVKVDIHRGSQEILGYTYPVDMVKDEKIRDRLYHIAIHNPISEIESIGKSDESGSINLDIPTWIWNNHMQHCINGYIQRAYQYVSITSVRSVLVFIKSLLIDYFLKISDNEEIKFNSLIKKEMPTTINNINASIVNTGDGTISTGSVTTVIGNNNTVDTLHVKDLSEIMQKLDALMAESNSEEYNEISADIKSELEKKAPSGKLLKRCFQAIGGLVSGVLSGVAANQLTPLITSALSML